MVNGRVFIREMMLTQAHARVKELEERGIAIEHSQFKDEFGFKSCRLAEGPKGRERLRVDMRLRGELKIIERPVW